MKQVLLRKPGESRTRRHRAESGLRELMLAVLEDALITYKSGLASPIPAQRVEAFRVEAWVASDDMDWPFSFRNVCHAVNVSPGYIRSCLVRWRRRALGDDEWVN